MKNRIAVMILGPLGDVINTSGIFKHLREVYPDAVLSIITIKRGLHAVKGIKEIDEQYFFDEDLNNNKLVKTLKFGYSLRGKFDTVLVLDNSLRSAMCAFMTGAKRRIGRGRELRELFLTDIIPFLKEEKNDEIPVSEHFARCLKPLGVYKENLGTYFTFSDEDEKSVVSLLKKEGIADKCKIGFCPACHAENKSMTIEDIAEIIKRFNEENKYKVVIIGGSDITDLISELKNFDNLEYYDFTGKTLFTETAALINKCDKFISVDTSCMHLALARKIPTVAIFFSNLFKKWGPRNLDFNKLYVNLNSRKVDINEIMQKLNSLPQKTSI